MEIKCNVSGSERQRLVRCLAKATGESAKYMRAPSFEYKVAGLTITADGTVIVADGTAPEEIRQISDAIRTGGFECDVPGIPPERPQLCTHEDYEDATVIAVEAPGITAELGRPIDNLIASKQTLICHALGVESVKHNAAWGWSTFTTIPPISDDDMHDAAKELFKAIVNHGLNAKRSTAKEKPATNEKYAFRCFLLRLGFIGDDTKAVRKTLMKNLSGSAAFKSKGDVDK